MNSETDTMNHLLQTRGRLAQLTRGDTRRPDDESAAGSAEEYTAFARGRAGIRPQMMICFRKCTGEVTVVAYSLLTKSHSEKPNRGFSMTFGDTKVTLEGENLTPLFQFIREHLPVEIVEADQTVVMSSDGKCVVSRILEVAA